MGLNRLKNEKNFFVKTYPRYNVFRLRQKKMMTNTTQDTHTLKLNTSTQLIMKEQKNEE